MLTTGELAREGDPRPRVPGSQGTEIYERVALVSVTMSPANPPERWEVELLAVREQLSQMRAEQRQMAAAIQELVRTFRALATHLGIAAEPYVRKDDPARQRDLPGFA